MTREPPTRRGFDADRANAVVQTLAILAAGAWAVYTFVYEARIKPGLEPPAVSVETRLVRAGEHGSQVAIRSTVTRRNVGQTGVRILGLAYTVTGIRAQFRDEVPDAAFTADLATAGRIAEARGYTLAEPGTVILRQGLLFAGGAEGEAEPSDLNPGEAVARDLIVYADRGRYDFVRFEVSLAYAKADEAPVRLRFTAAGDGRLGLAPRVDCRTDRAACDRLKTTDFATEFSLW
ncbi:hypothetical protein [uncultured Methylobacterium sp.]|jgi:hypothetical protein|uniref:hypothetical protein n=1 Tax=uncultured Methylobacterium sp. TaxID=157278 RepID=UPI0026302838|nr:hypothetical protein [uncultured Methylobacterium sp.]